MRTSGGTADSLVRRALPIYLGLLFALLTVVALLLLYALRHVLLILFVSVLFAAALSGPSEWLHDRLRLPRGIAAVLIYVVSFGVLVGVGWLVVPPLLGQVAEFADRAPEYADRYEGIRKAYGELRNDYPALPPFDEQMSRLGNAILDRAGERAAALPGSLFSLFLDLLSVFVISLLLVTNHEVTALSDGYALYKRAHLVNPYIRVGLVVNRVPDEARARSAWERFQSASQRFLGHSPEFVGWVAADPAVARSVELRVPVSLLEPDSPAACAIEGVSQWAPIDQARGARAFFERHFASMMSGEMMQGMMGTMGPMGTGPASPTRHAFDTAVADTFRTSMHEALFVGTGAALVAAIGVSLFVTTRVVGPITWFSKAASRL